MSITIRDIPPGELSAIPSLNDSEVPHVNSMTRTMLERFAREAAYFRIAQRNETMAGFLIGLTPGADYDSPNYRWFSQHYEHFHVYRPHRRCHSSARPRARPSLLRKPSGLR